MTKTERVELMQLTRKRERVMKHYADEHAARMQANFDEQLASIYSFDQDEVWAKATDEAQKAVEAANKEIAERCKRLGIPKDFAPALSFGWMGRGQNAVAGRRAELRRAAMSRIKAIREEAHRKIERMCLTAQTEIVTHGLESDVAKKFLESMVPVEELMPAIDVHELQQLEDKKKREKRQMGIWE